MRIESTPIEGLQLVHLDIYLDKRGYFVERFNRDKFEQLGIETEFIQDNHSLSHPKVLRGLHMQTNPLQAKLIGCTRGAILDVAVDLRPNSKSYGESFAVKLSESEGVLLWIPEGFAHGFCVLGDEPAHVTYKVNGAYNPKGEMGIRWDDPDLKIEWPYSDPIVSEKDQLLPTLNEFKEVERCMSHT